MIKFKLLPSIDKKLLRDFWHLRAQVFAIALVIVSGVAMFIMSLSTLDSLQATQRNYYKAQNFAHIFASLKRAPDALLSRIQDIPGVKTAEGRVKAYVNVEVKGFTDPIIGQLISFSEYDKLNYPYLRKGRLVDPNRDNEILLSEAFAKAHHLSLGDSITAIIDGHKKALKIVGIALSPETIYQLAPGALFPDFKRYAVMWMEKKPFQYAYDMEGAFNEVVIAKLAGAKEAEIKERLDLLLQPYGGLGAYPREEQLSHRFLTEEFKALKTMSIIFPVIFFGVAAFLLNIVITRLVATQREQIGILKAFGFTNQQIGVHYLKLVSLVVIIGIVLGTGVGVWLGKGLSKIYSDFYKFPYLYYTLYSYVVIYAALICFAVAFIGAGFAVKRAVTLPPAVAMRPEAPPSFHESAFEKLDKKYFSGPTLMMFRSIIRRPIKALLSVLGIAFACAVMMIGNFQQDAIDYMVDIQFGMTQKEDINVAFTDPSPKRAIYSILNLPGVNYVEGFRSVPIRLRFEHKTYLTSVQGIDLGAKLQKVLNTNLNTIQLPPEGLVLTDFLGKILGVKVGDWVTLETLEGHQEKISVQVVGLTKQFMGVSAYMRRDALNRLMKEGDVISGALITHDKTNEVDIYRRLNEMPKIASISAKKNMLSSFYETFAETILIFTFIVSILGGVLAFGIIYNNARIALAERSRELATLRIIGFTLQEIGYILFGELALLTFIAIPIGFIIGAGLCYYLASQLQSDLYRVPLVLTSHTYALSTLVILISSGVSFVFVWRGLVTLNLIEVLKIKE